MPGRDYSRKYYSRNIYNAKKDYSRTLQRPAIEAPGEGSPAGWASSRLVRRRSISAIDARISKSAAERPSTRPSRRALFPTTGAALGGGGVALGGALGGPAVAGNPGLFHSWAFLRCAGQHK